MPLTFLSKTDRTTLPLSDEEDRQIRLQLVEAIKRMELLKSDVAELENRAVRYQTELTQLHARKGRHRRFVSRISAFLASVGYRAGPDKVRWSKPPDDEKSIRRSLAAVEKKIRIYTKQLAQLDKQVVRFRIAVAPHKRLPEDVLRHIFTLSCADSRESSTALVLSQVCSAWRRLVLDIPPLYHQRKLILDGRSTRRRQVKLSRRQARLSHLQRLSQIIIGVLRAGKYLDRKLLSHRFFNI